ncbi:MAG: hypothetical protein HWN67_20370 [Candidatus Helarchaeota archaeon]|nr:hypothetical protein [Candidatus Helarchaeota archaeon]
MNTKLKEEIQIAEAIIRKADQILKEKESEVGDLKPVIEEKISTLKDAINNKDINLIQTTMDELQVPIHQLSAKIYEHTQKNVDPLECDNCQVSFKLPPGLAPKTAKKKKEKDEEVVDSDLDID